MILLVFLVCQCTNKAQGQWSKTEPQPRQYTLSLNEYLTLAHNENGESKQDLLIKAAAKAIEDGRQNQALTILAQTETLTPLQNRQKTILLAKLDIKREQTEAAKKKLQTLDEKDTLPKDFQAQLHMLLAEAWQKTGQLTEAVNARLQADTLLSEQKSLEENRLGLWSSLMMMSPSDLTSLYAQTPDDSVLKGWAKLALIPLETNASNLIQALEQWQNNFPNHPANYFLPNPLMLVEGKIQPQPQQIALLLPLTGPLSGPGEAIRDGFMAAKKNYPLEKNLNVRIYDTAKQPANELYQQALLNGADYIIGPLGKQEVASVASMVHPVPTLFLSEAGTNMDDNVYQFGFSASDEAVQVAKKAGNRGYVKALILAPQGAWGKETAAAFTKQWEAQGGLIVDKHFYGSGKNLAKGIRKVLEISASESRVKQLKNTLGKDFEARLSRRTDVDMIFLLAYPSKARQIMPMLKYYYAGNIPVYATSSIYAGRTDTMRDKDLNGIIFCDMPKMFSSATAYKQWPEQFNSYRRLFALGMDSFTVATHLNTLKIFPVMQASDKNGLLSLKPYRQITRDLAFGHFQNGQVQLLDRGWS